MVVNILSWHNFSKTNYHINFYSSFDKELSKWKDCLILSTWAFLLQKYPIIYWQRITFSSVYFQWYKVKLEKMPESLASKFVQLDPDADTQNFIHQSEEKSEWFLTQIWHSIAKAFLSWFMSQTSINGYVLSLFSMFSYSSTIFPSHN